MLKLIGKILLTILSIGFGAFCVVKDSLKLSNLLSNAKNELSQK